MQFVIHPDQLVNLKKKKKKKSTGDLQISKEGKERKWTGKLDKRSKF